MNGWREMQRGGPGMAVALFSLSFHVQTRFSAWFGIFNGYFRCRTRCRCRRGRSPPVSRGFPPRTAAVYLFIGSLLADPCDIEDVYQQTCLALWKKRDRMGEVRDFFSWACGFARKEVLHQIRRNARKGAVSLSEPLLMQLADEFEAELDDDLRLSALTTCLSKLQARQRELLKRCYAGDEPIKVIAASMAISAAALTMRLQRIRHAVVRCIDKTLAEGLSP